MRGEGNEAREEHTLERGVGRPSAAVTSDGRGVDCEAVLRVQESASVARTERHRPASSAAGRQGSKGRTSSFQNVLIAAPSSHSTSSLVVSPMQSTTGGMAVTAGAEGGAEGDAEEAGGGWWC